MIPHKGGKPTDGDELILLERRRVVASMYCGRKSQWEIARAVGVDRSQVSRDLEWLRQEWLASALQDFDQRQAEELARLDHLERVAWEAWERSCKDAETLHERKVKGKVSKGGASLPEEVTTNLTIKGQSGDPRFLERVAWCIQKRCEITGVLRQTGPGASSSVVVVGGVDLEVVLGQKPGIPHDRLNSASPN